MCQTQEASQGVNSVTDPRGELHGLTPPAGFSLLLMTRLPNCIFVADVAAPVDEGAAEGAAETEGEGAGVAGLLPAPGQLLLCFLFRPTVDAADAKEAS